MSRWRRRSWKIDFKPMDFEQLLIIAKHAEIPDEWAIDPNHRGTRLMAFGLLNQADGSRIQGASVQLRCTQLERSKLRKYTFGMFHGGPITRIDRVYMLEVGPPQNCRHKNKDGTWINGPHVLSLDVTDGPFLELLDQRFELLFKRFAGAINLSFDALPDDPFELRLR